MLPAQPNKSLIDGIDLLLALVAADEPIGVRELARRIGMETTRVQRLLGTLAWQGMAARTADRKYIPGPGIHVLSAMSLGASGLLPRALNDLQALGDTGYIVALGVVWRDEMTYLYHGGPGISPGDAMARGAHFPAARSALGQVLLAKLDAETLDRHVPAEQRPNGPAAFAERLAAIRAAGYARAPQAPGIISLAVPVGEPAYAALGLAGAIPEPDQAELIARLHSVAAHISQS